MTELGCPAAFLLLLCFAVSGALSSEPLAYSVNTKKWSHVLDDHFISVTINPTDLLQGKAFGLGMNSTVAILKGLSPAYIRIGSADTGKYTFKRSRYPSDVARAEDEFIITESHWTTLNDVVRSAGLDVVVCLNAAHRNGASNKWDTRNSLELISFSDSQGYNLTFQLGYEVQRSSGLSGHQYGKDLKRLRTILNAFPRYQNSKLIGPDIRYLHKKDDIEFVNDVLMEAGPVLDAVTWHPRWPQPSKMKVSDVSELGYEFPADYIEWDRSQLGRILQRSILKNPIWIGEPKTESTGTFAEGLLWARRLILAAKLGVEVVMKQPSLMDISHPKPEYWIAFLHKRLLGKAVLETRAVNNQTEIAVITHCTNPLFWSERSNKAVDGAVTVYAVNMGGKEQRVNIRSAWGGKSQVMLQYLLTSGSDPDSVFSQMTYLNGEPLMMTDDGHLPDITPRVRRIDRGVVFKLPPYSVGFWVIPDARIKICQVQPAPAASANFDNLSTGMRHGQKNIPNIRNLNQLIVDKLKNPVSESDEEFYDDRTLSDFSSERDLTRESLEAPAPRASRRVRQITVEDIGQELKEKIREIRDMLETNRASADKDPSETLRAAEEKITSLTEELGAATRLSNQQEEFGRFLHQSGLNQDFGALMVNGRTGGLPGVRRSVSSKWDPLTKVSTTFDPFEAKVRRFRRSLSSPEDDYEEESTESYSSEEETFTKARPNWKINYRKSVPGLHETSDESGDNSGYSGPPVLKGFEDKYRTFLSHRIQDGKRKLSDLRKQKTKKSDTEESRKTTGKKANTLGNDLHEEILMKEVEVLQKTEEAMANLIKNHKKRQQTIQEIILHEISDIKEDRLSALEDLRQQKELNEEEDRQDEGIPQKLRNVADVIHFPQKTKRSVGEEESSVNALPEEEKKSKIIKRSVDSSYERSLRRRKSRKSSHDEGDSSRERGSRRNRKSRSERLERMKNFIQSRERIRDRNILRRKHNRNLRKSQSNASEESNEVLRDYGNDYIGKSEDMVIKEIQKELLKKPERSEVKSTESEGMKKEKKIEERVEEKPAPVKKEDKSASRSNNNNDSNSSTSSNNNNNNSNNESNNTSESSGANEKRMNGGQSDKDSQKMRAKAEEKSYQEATTTPRTAVKKVKSEEPAEYVPLKIDKNRGLNVLKRISNLVESINTREKSKARKPSIDVEDLSEEFYGDSISKISKRRHRRSHHHDGEAEESKTDEQGELESAESPLKDLKELKALRKEIKLRKLLERRMRRKKQKEEAAEDDQSEGKRTTSRLKGKLQGKHPQQIPSEPSSDAMQVGGAEQVGAVAAKESQREDAEPATGTEQATTEIPTQREEMKAEKEQVAVESPQPTDTATEAKQVSAEEEPRHLFPEAGVEQVVAKESPQQENVQAKEEPGIEENVSNKEDTEMREEQSVKDKVLQGEGIEKQTDKVAAVPDEKIEGTVEEVKSPEKSDSAVDENPKIGNVNDLNEEAEHADEASKLENVQKISSAEESVTERTTVDSGKTKSSSAADETEGQPSGAEPAEDPATILVLPEIEGFVFNPLMMANPPEEIDYQQEEMSAESPVKEDRFVVLDQFLQEEPPRDEVYDGPVSSENKDNDEVGESGPADLLSELMEGDKLKPWKGAILDTVEELKSKVKPGHRRSYAAAAVESEGSAEEEVSVQREDGTQPSFGHPPELPSESYMSRMPGETQNESRSGSDVADPSIMEVVPTETGDARIPEKRTPKTRALRRTRRGIFDRRPQTPEEKIRSFKRIIHRRHSPFGHRNEIPVINEGENFWKMAGSTVKAVFNDVIPDAYGKTKNKIENLGIAEYFKEFGKIVEQMKNLDKLFANIGQAAVRNYIKGTEDEKGDYIQVIEKRRRSRRDVEGVADAKEGVQQTAVLDAKQEEDDGSVATVDPSPEVTTERIIGEEATTAAGNNIRAKGLRNYVKQRPNDLIRDIFLMDSNPGIVEVTKSPPTAEPPQTITLQPFESRYAKIPKMNVIRGRFFKRDETSTEVQMPEMNKFAPWMKTTKEFINQALTTLQRQRELSEMIARESVNDLVKREIERKVIGKRETGEDRRVFPVYQMPPNRKREIYGHPEDSLARYPSHLQPGVYIVPTEDMQNLRSEQIMKESSSTKPGMPNMVTLNIYYDKKKPQEWDTSKEVIDTEKLDADYMRYYQEPSYAWNPVPAVNHGPEYLPPLQEPAIDARYLPQTMPPFAPEPKFHDSRLLPYGEPYHEWIPRGYPPALPRSQPPYLYPVENHYPKSDWQELKHSLPEAGSLGNGGVADSGWAVHFQPAKKKSGRSRESVRAIDRQQRLLPDKKRSVGSKTDAGFPGLALPFWKFANSKKQPESVEKTANSESGESLEELFAENRRRARLNELKEKEQKPEEAGKRQEEEEDDAEGDGKKTEEEAARRRRRDVTQPAALDFHDSDLVPEWLGTVQDLDNDLREYRGTARVVGLPWSGCEEENELLPVESVQFHRARRSAGDKTSSEDEARKVLKKVTDPDSSLEAPDAEQEKNASNPPETADATTADPDALSQFFKHAYDSLVQMMKKITGFI